jgi:chromosome segregation ATPase
MDNFKNNIKEIITEHTRKLTELIGEKEELFDKYSKLLNQKSLLEKKLSNTNKESSEVRSQHNRIVELDDPEKDKEIDKLTNKLQKLNEEKDSIISEKSDIEKKLDKTKNDLEKLQQENEKYLNNIKELEARNTKNLKEIEELKNDIEILNSRATIFDEKTDNTNDKINKLTTSYNSELELLRKQLTSKEKDLLEKEELLNNMKEQTNEQIQDLNNQIKFFYDQNSDILAMMTDFQKDSERLFDRAKTYNISESMIVPKKNNSKFEYNIPPEFTQKIPPEFTQKSILEMINYIEQSITRYSGKESTNDITNIINIIKTTLQNRIFNNNIKDKMKEHINKIKILCENISDNNEYFCEIKEALGVLLKKILKDINVIYSDSDSDSESMIGPQYIPSRKLIKTETNTSEGSDARFSELSDTSDAKLQK